MKDRYFKFLALTIIAGVLLAFINPTPAAAAKDSPVRAATAVPDGR